MISYKNTVPFLLLFRVDGSVFPLALVVASFSALLGMVLKLLQREQMFENELSERIMFKAAVYSGFTFLVGFFVIFRTTQAYFRFWEGCTTAQSIRGQIFDTVSALISYSKVATAAPEEVKKFNHLMLRLFSMLHAMILSRVTGDLEWNHEESNYPLIDAEGLDIEHLMSIRHENTGCQAELVLQWITQLISRNTATGVLAIPAPILSRAFQQLAMAKVSFEDIVKICDIQFPFPYAQTTTTLLLIHWFMCPVAVCQWVEWVTSAGTFTFLQVFIMWSLNLIAEEIEQPFGTDANDLNAEYMQEEMNDHLQLLLSCEAEKTPVLSDTVIYDVDQLYTLLRDGKMDNGDHAASWHQLVLSLEDDTTKEPTFEDRVSRTERNSCVGQESGTGSKSDRSSVRSTVSSQALQGVKGAQAFQKVKKSLVGGHRSKTPEARRKLEAEKVQRTSYSQRESVDGGRPSSGAGFEGCDVREVLPQSTPQDDESMALEELLLRVPADRRAEVREQALELLRMPLLAALAASAADLPPPAQESVPCTPLDEAAAGETIAAPAAAAAARQARRPPFAADVNSAESAAAQSTAAVRPSPRKLLDEGFEVELEGSLVPLHAAACTQLQRLHPQVREQALELLRSPPSDSPPGPYSPASRRQLQLARALEMQALAEAPVVPLLNYVAPPPAPPSPASIAMGRRLAAAEAALAAGPCSPDAKLPKLVAIGWQDVELSNGHRESALERKMELL
eukprot:gnl/TRDRNA2_/TRDRNA2_135682_c0_seq1.p1 gnl/TRDRNA2_/TRDRNA2_135682_c0~~gnl/TRDRNA2_/TRDRNA2_135682_c0_seq1.p1  ORF type:complete len:736 (+),score=143.21 gnl/TRDRNA2_/TRDRNA2_135682_c0_seq1:124-2331(+)